MLTDKRRALNLDESYETDHKTCINSAFGSDEIMLDVWDERSKIKSRFLGSGYIAPVFGAWPDGGRGPKG